MPSVMHTTNPMPAAPASRMAAGAPFGGTATNDPLDVLAALARRDAGDDQRPVGLVAQAVEPALSAGQALHDDLGVGVDEDRHVTHPLLNRWRCGRPRGRPRASSAC